MPVLLLPLFSFVLSVGIGIMVLVIRHARQKRPGSTAESQSSDSCPHERACVFRRPGCWLAIKSRSLLAVKSALGLSNAKPCSWTDGFAGEQKLFIAPPIKGWVLVIGSGLPDPNEDVDACFRFITGLSRRLGQVQFFSASQVLRHHAWIRADAGRVLRAYAWAGRTLWQQGPRTAAEKELDLKSFDYSETPERQSFGQPDVLSLNTEKVPLLAARWSLDPARIDERWLQAACGIAGESCRKY
jgi:hypothetical protein